MSQGRVLWITGLSAAGKSTVARAALDQLRRSGVCAVLLDGDEVRRVVADDGCGHDRESRLVNAYRICRLAGLLAGQGLVVLVATMSLYHEVHAWNRENLPDYFEVLLRVGLDTVRSRDPKGLYRKVENGQEQNLCGLDLEAELPREPHLVLDNDRHLDDVAGLAAALLAAAGLAPGLQGA